jgi:hypothetical protein
VEKTNYWIEEQLNNEKNFPITVGGKYPKNFPSIVKVSTLQILQPVSGAFMCAPILPAHSTYTLVSEHSVPLQTIMKRIFRVYAHSYWCHYVKMDRMGVSFLKYHTNIHVCIF